MNLDGGYVATFFEKEDRRTTNVLTQMTIDRAIEAGADAVTTAQRVAGNEEMTRAVYHSIAKLLDQRLEFSSDPRLFQANDAADIATSWAEGNASIYSMLEFNARIVIGQIELMLKTITGHKSMLHAAKMLNCNIASVAAKHEVTIYELLEDDGMRAKVIRAVTTRNKWTAFLEGMKQSVISADPTELCRVLIKEELKRTITDPQELDSRLEEELNSATTAITTLRKKMTRPAMEKQAAIRINEIWPPCTR